MDNLVVKAMDYQLDFHYQLFGYFPVLPQLIHHRRLPWWNRTWNENHDSLLMRLMSIEHEGLSLPMMPPVMPCCCCQMLLLFDYYLIDS
jgi:hypothetical protein